MGERADSLDDFLEHYGVLGMKWGVRKDNSGNGGVKEASKNEGEIEFTRADAKWKSKIDKPSFRARLVMKTSDEIAKQVPELNRKYKDKDLGYDPNTGEYTTALGKKRNTEYQALASAAATRVANELLGDSPSGNWTTKATYHMVAPVKDRSITVEVVPKEVRHDSLHESFEDFLEHYGVLGMKWGVRRTDAQLDADRAVRDAKEARKAASSEAKRVRKETRQDERWARKASSRLAQVQVYNDMAKMMAKDGFGKTKQDPRFAGKKPLESNDIRLRQEYLDTVQATANRYAKKAQEARFGKSPNGRVDILFKYDSKAGVKVEVIRKDEDVEHSDDNVLAVLNAKVVDGYIVELEELSAEHADSLDDFLEHYGVLGMKWGVRRSARQLAKARGESRVQAMKAQGKTGYVEKGSKLTESQLTARIKRMETEKRYNELNSRTVSEGEKIAREILTNVGKKTATITLTAVALTIVKPAIEAKFGPEAANMIRLPKK